MVYRLHRASLPSLLSPDRWLELRYPLCEIPPPTEEWSGVRARAMAEEAEKSAPLTTLHPSLPNCLATHQASTFFL